MQKNMNIAIILAAGRSLRMKGIDKIETQINGKPLITYTLAPFLQSKHVDKIIITANRDNIAALKKIFPRKIFRSIYFTIGSKTRFQSARNAFDYSKKIFKPSQKSIVLFHNCGNVLVTRKEIDDSIRMAKKHGACIVAHSATDTLKKISGKKIMETLNRDEIIHAQTPQTFQYGIMENAYLQNKNATDESSLVEAAGHKVTWIPVSEFNRKITTQIDIMTVKTILEEDRSQVRCATASDSHFFESKNHTGHLTLCGIAIKNLPKLSADSDGDAALHAITAAISQAITGGSLGTFATSMYHHGIKNSKKYLQKILIDMRNHNLTIIHLGLHFECTQPNIDRLAPQFKISLSKLLSITPQNIGITASSGKLRFNSNHSGIHCTASITLN
jgi:2-C-methyl-D-erythritol 4-phosphate cytidylyltransferase/2-C-methyl-D-erythritol 2,4-cyclodiphosphate synthase